MFSESVTSGSVISGFSIEVSYKAIWAFATGNKRANVNTEVKNYKKYFYNFIHNIPPFRNILTSFHIFVNIFQKWLCMYH